ncbi:MAG: transposase [Thermodesulfobacteriota bacterium]
MPRQPRLDIPGLLQHVIIRGIERSDIFITDADRRDFVRRLEFLLQETKTLCYAWALLDNHVHLLLMPTQDPLAAIMRRLLTGYAVSFNRRHHRSGHLFQNRYKSIVCDEEVYLLELVRYIHLNPVRAGKAAALDVLVSYPWSGHQQLLGKSQYDLLAEKIVLFSFGRTKKTARKAYMQFLYDGLHQDIPYLSTGGRQTSQNMDDSLTEQDLYDERILGGGIFVENILKRVTPIADRHISLEEIIKSVADYYKLDAEQLCWPSKVRIIAEARAVICFLATRRYQLSGREVMEKLCYTPSAVSRATQRGWKIFEGNDRLHDIV